MDFWTYGVDIATMATGLSAVTAASVWVTGRVNAFRKHRAEQRDRVWNIGYTMMGVVPSWNVRGRLTIPPTPAQESFLKDIERARRRGGFPVR